MMKRNNYPRLHRLVIRQLLEMLGAIFSYTKYVFMYKVLWRQRELSSPHAVVIIVRVEGHEEAEHRQVDHHIARQGQVARAPLDLN